MTPVLFPESNVTYAKDQPQYLPLPAHVHPADTNGTVTTCWRLTLRERVRALLTGRLWMMQWTFGEPLQPQRPSVDKPEHLAAIERLAGSRMKGAS